MTPNPKVVYTINYICIFYFFTKNFQNTMLSFYKNCIDFPDFIQTKKKQILIVTLHFRVNIQKYLNIEYTIVLFILEYYA